MRRFATIDSTNRWLLDEARAGGAEGLVAVADHQTAGRGRLGRTWEAPPGGNLLVSLLFRPAGLRVDRFHLVVALVALAACDAVEAVGGFRPALKWPNDLVVDDRKLAGVLAEMDLPAVVVGIGVNLVWAPPDLPAVAATDVAGRPVDRDTMLDALLAAAGRLYGDWDTVADRYRDECATVGRDVRVELASETFTGRAIDITADGHLVVATGEAVRMVAAGDVIHLRSAP